VSEDYSTPTDTSTEGIIENTIDTTENQSEIMDEINYEEDVFPDIQDDVISDSMSEEFNEPAPEFPLEIEEDVEPERDFDDNVKVLKRDEFDLLSTGYNSINDVLDAKADNYRDQGFTDDEVASFLAKDKVDLQQEFLNDAFPGQDVSHHVFNGFENKDYSQINSIPEDTLQDSIDYQNQDDEINVQMDFSETIKVDIPEDSEVIIDGDTDQDLSEDIYEDVSEDITLNDTDELTEDVAEEFIEELSEDDLVEENDWGDDVETQADQEQENELFEMENENFEEEVTDIESPEEASDISTWLGDINPNFDEFDINSPYCNNCGSCAYSVYQRLEGNNDACASAENIGYNHEMTALTGMEQVSMSPDEIEARLLQEGEGAHAIIGIDRAEGAGHWFNAACIDGKVVAIDGQNGQIVDWPPDYGNVVNWEMSVKKGDRQ